MTGVFVLGTEPVGKAFPPTEQTSAFRTLVEAASQNGQYLVEITAYKGGEVRSGGLWTLGEGPLGAVAGGTGVSVGQVELVYGDRHWIADPDDPTRPNTFYEGRVTVPLAVERRMPLLPEDGRRVTRQFGTIEIANGDGELDSVVLANAVDGRQVRVLYGPAEE